MRRVLTGLLLCVSLLSFGLVDTPSIAAPATPSPDELTFEEGIYFGQVSTTLNLFAESLGRYSAAVSVPNPLDPVWRANAGAEPRMWQALSNQFATVNPPRRFAATHEQLLDALDALALAADHCISGIDNLDITAATACGTGITDATVLINKVELPVMPAAP